MSATRQILSTSGGRRLRVDIVRLSSCDHQQDTPAQHLDVGRVSVMLRCADCGQPRIVLTGETLEVIAEVLNRWRAAEDLPAPAPGPEPEAAGASTDPADVFGRWLARQGPGAIQPPPRPPRERRAAGPDLRRRGQSSRHS
jgi:hypothetical protein